MDTRKYEMKQCGREITTAVEDMDRNAPTNIPSDDLPPHNCRQDLSAFIRNSLPLQCRTFVKQFQIYIECCTNELLKCVIQTSMQLRMKWRKKLLRNNCYILKCKIFFQ